MVLRLVMCGIFVIYIYIHFWFVCPHFFVFFVYFSFLVSESVSFRFFPPFFFLVFFYFVFRVCCAYEYYVFVVSLVVCLCVWISWWVLRVRVTTGQGSH